MLFINCLYHDAYYHVSVMDNRCYYFCQKKEKGISLLFYVCWGQLNSVQLKPVNFIQLINNHYWHDLYIPLSPKPISYFPAPYNPEIVMRESYAYFTQATIHSPELQL